MIGCLRTRVRKQPIIALYFESETVPKFITSRPVHESLIFIAYAQKPQINVSDDVARKATGQKLV